MTKYMLRKALWVFLRPLMQLITNLLSPEMGEEWLTELNKFLRKEPTWTGRVFGKLETVAPVKSVSEGFDNGVEYLAQAEKLAKYAGKRVGDRKDYDFYRMKRNWHLMPPRESNIRVVIFPEPQFMYDSLTPSFRALQRNGDEWFENAHFVERFFTEVAVVVAVS